MTTTKKNIKVKKGKGDISITIENNLNANNKQINNNHEPIERRRRRKKKVENNDEIDTLEELPPVTDTSYIKPGPVGAFKMVRPAQPGAGAGPGAQEISFDNFQRFLAMLMENQRNGNPANDVRPPPAWGSGLVDDDEPVIIPPPQFVDDEPVIIPPPQFVDDEPVIIPPLQSADDEPVITPPRQPIIIPPPQPVYDPPRARGGLRIGRRRPLPILRQNRRRVRDRPLRQNLDSGPIRQQSQQYV
jgi:hypothetical protein